MTPPNATEAKKTASQQPTAYPAASSPKTKIRSKANPVLCFQQKRDSDANFQPVQPATALQNAT
jgi:hypothetical protein